MVRDTVAVETLARRAISRISKRRSDVGLRGHRENTTYEKRIPIIGDGKTMGRQMGEKECMLQENYPARNLKTVEERYRAAGFRVVEGKSG